MDVTLAQHPFYAIDTIQKIEIQFSQTNWDYQLDTSKLGSEDYIIADWVKINGVQFDSAGVKYKGNSSYDSTFIKNPLHIALDEFKSQNYLGLTDIKLGNGYADPSMIREVMSYEILNNYMDCPKANFAQLYINGNYIGLYSNDESISKKFCLEHFFSNQNTFIKCNPIVIPGPTTKSNLKYISNDSSQYFNFYELKSKKGWNELVALCDTVTNFSSNISFVMDVDRLLWMLSFNSVLVNLDSYTGVFCQNYYLYKDSTNRFNPVVWDLNMSLGGFPYVGSSNSSLAGLTIANMQQLPLSFHSTDPYWPLIKNVFSNLTNKRKYIAHARTICNEFFSNTNYLSLATQLQAVADTAVLSDTNKFFSYTQFASGLTTDNIVGSYMVPGISNLMNARVNYLQSTTEFIANPPVIDSVKILNQVVYLMDSVKLTVKVSNADSVWFGIRFLKTEKFQLLPMFDDGLHNDGLPGDLIYGTSFKMENLQAQYYFYTENNSAGIFSPQRAEHEFYNLDAKELFPQLGDIVINEFVASNLNGPLNEIGESSDWIELYNTSTKDWNLSGLYLSDKYLIPQKYAFPKDFTIRAKDYLIVWADNNSSTITYPHCNFKLSSAGEMIMLSAKNGLILDSVSYDAVVSDEAIARCPDGTGEFFRTTNTTFGASNCIVKANPFSSEIYSLSVFPNPVDKSLDLYSDLLLREKLEIFGALGQKFYQGEMMGELSINTSNWANGIYLIHKGNIVKKVVVAHVE